MKIILDTNEGALDSRLIAVVLSQLQVTNAPEKTAEPAKSALVEAPSTEESKAAEPAKSVEEPVSDEPKPKPKPKPKRKKKTEPKPAPVEEPKVEETPARTVTQAEFKQALTEHKNKFGINRTKEVIEKLTGKSHPAEVPADKYGAAMDALNSDPGPKADDLDLSEFC